MVLPMTPRAERKSEVESKLTRLRERMAARQIDAVVLTTTPNTAWITAGASTFVNQASDTGVATVIVTYDHAYIVTTTIEAPRLRQEELVEALGFEVIAEPWYAPGKAAAPLLLGKRVGQDGPTRDANVVPVGPDLQHLRSVLQAEEVSRIRHVAALAAEVMDDTIRSARPGDTEYQLAARLAAESRMRGAIAIVNLVASDERIYQYRHPLPTAKTVERYAMVVLGMRFEGLVAAITRLVHFGPLPDDLRYKAMATARVDARLILGTRAGRTLGDMFEVARRAYQQEGFPEAIEEHHQGGMVAYQPREIIARPDDPTPIQVNQVFAWNPSIRGAKSEDTILLGPDGPTVITQIRGWPMWTVSVDDQSIERPAILES
jgi:Xaa-Pro aminopeptidase